MKTLLTILLALCVNPGTLKGPYAIHCPNFSDRMLVVIEYDAGDEGIPWEIDRPKTTPMRTDAGELIDADSFFCPRIVAPGHPDPRSTGAKVLGDGKRLVVWELERPKKDCKTIKRLAGSYELTHGGKVHWLDIPVDQEPGAEPTEWANEHLKEAGFVLKRGRRVVPQLHVKVSGKVFDFDKFQVLGDTGNEMESKTSSRGGKDYTEQFDLKGEDPKDLKLIVHLEDGTQITIDKIPAASKYRRLRGSKWKKAGITVETRVTHVSEYYAKGTGDFDAYANYRWVNSKGKPLNISPASEASGTKTTFTSACRSPLDLPKGARLEMGVLVGAVTEWLEYEYLDVPMPK